MTLAFGIEIINLAIVLGSRAIPVESDYSQVTAVKGTSVPI